MFKAYVNIALNTPMKSRASRAWIWASYISKVLQYYFLPLNICQTNTPYAMWEIITILNIYLKAKKFLPYIDPAIFDTSLMILIIFLLTFDI